MRGPNLFTIGLTDKLSEIVNRKKIDVRWYDMTDSDHEYIWHIMLLFLVLFTYAIHLHLFFIFSLRELIYQGRKCIANFVRAQKSASLHQTCIPTFYSCLVTVGWTTAIIQSRSFVLLLLLHLLVVSSTAFMILTFLWRSSSSSNSFTYGSICG